MNVNEYIILGIQQNLLVEGLFESEVTDLGKEWRWV